MIVNVNREYEGTDFRTVFNFHYRKTAADVVSAVLRLEKCPYDAEVDIRLISDENMRNLNSRTRNIDRTTDVLSFPMVQYDPPADFKILKNAGADAFDPDSGLLMLGDIVLSVQKIRTQAFEYGHTARREYAFLIAHSMLHLLGYDHRDEQEESLMIKKQEAVLYELNITRQGGQR